MPNFLKARDLLLALFLVFVLALVMSVSGCATASDSDPYRPIYDSCAGVDQGIKATNQLVLAGKISKANAQKAVTGFTAAAAACNAAVAAATAPEPAASAPK